MTPIHSRVSRRLYQLPINFMPQGTFSAFGIHLVHIVNSLRDREKLEAVQVFQTRTDV